MTNLPWGYMPISPRYWDVHGPDRAVGIVTSSESDARLMAAAPDLLDACEELLIYLADWDDPDNETCVKARAAIAKAKEGK